MQLSDLKELISEIYPRFMAVAPLVLAIILGTYLLNLLVGRALIVLANRTRLTEMDVLPFRQVLRWVTRFLSGILILSVLGFEIGGLWAMLSTVLGLVAIGFVAVWSILSHTSATMLILFLHPFQMGDDLEFAGEPVQGRAVDINFFFTTLVDHEGVLHQIPNNLFFQKALKRRRNAHIISLAAQLNSPDPVPVDLPPKPALATDAKVKEPDAIMNYPDPKSFLPPSRTGK
jgi:small-conductance mechanosensitive channel